MRSHVADQFRSVRLSRGVSLSQLARQVGYRNVSKGCRRIGTFEQTGQVTDDLLMKLANALGIDAATVEELKERDRQEWERWAAEPIEPFMVIRVFSAAYCRRHLPDEINDLEQAEAWAAGVARQLHKRICLVWNRREMTYLDCKGQVEKRSANSTPPTMAIDGKPIHFELNEQQ
jgi:transcriptional regulator with XRE-family HTH domain